MSPQSKRRLKLKRLINNHVNASIDLAFIGSLDPEQHEVIRERQKKTKRKLFDHVNSLFILELEVKKCSE